MRTVHTEFDTTVPTPPGIVPCASLPRRWPDLAKTQPHPLRFAPGVWREAQDASAATVRLGKLAPEQRIVVIPEAGHLWWTPLYQAENGPRELWVEHAALRLAWCIAGTPSRRWRAEYLVPALSQLHRHVPDIFAFALDCEAIFGEGGQGMTKAESDRMFAIAAQTLGDVDEDIVRAAAEKEPLATMRAQIVPVLEALWPKAHIFNFGDAVTSDPTPQNWKTHGNLAGCAACPLYRADMIHIGRDQETGEPNGNPGMVDYTRRQAAHGFTMPILPHIGLFSHRYTGGEAVYWTAELLAEL